MTKMLFYKTGNDSISVKLDWREGYRYQQGTGRSIRRNKGKDAKEYPLIVSYNVLDNFMSNNGLTSDNVVVDEKSVEKFYGFYDSWKRKWFVSANLSEGFVSEWWNYDCPDIYRLAPNRDGHSNYFGIKLYCFENLLCESSFYATYVGSDITEEEVEKLTKGREHTSICKEMNLMIKSRKVSNEEIEEMKIFVRDFEEKVQTIVDLFEDEITEAVSTFNDSPPAGFLNIYTNNREYNEKKSMLRELDKSGHHAKWLNVKLPVQVQSIDVQRMQFDIVKEKVSKALNIDLHSETRLD